MQKSRRIWWLCGWFPGSSMPFAGNFVWRHAKAVKENMPETDLVLLHFPLFYWGEMPPTPVGDECGEWQMDTRYSLNFGYKWKGNKGANSNQSGGELLLYYRPVLQFKSGLLRPLNFLMYCLVVAYRLFRMNSLMGKPDLLHLHVADKIGLPFVWLKSTIWKQVKVFYTEHWAIFGTPVQDRYERRNPIFRYYFKRVWNRVDWAAGISVFTHQWMQKTFHEAKRMISFPNVVDTDIFYAFPESKSHEPIVFLHVSNFESRKRVAEIIAAFQAFEKQFDQKVELKLVGGSKDQMELQKHNEINLDAENLHWLGRLSSADVAKEMNCSSALILFSTAENAPCVISEALCCGLPVVSNAIAAIPEMILNEQNGVLISDDFLELVNAFERVLPLSEAINRLKIAEAAKQKYSSSAVCKDLIRAYKTSLEGGKKGCVG